MAWNYSASITFGEKNNLYIAIASIEGPLRLSRELIFHIGLSEASFRYRALKKKNGFRFGFGLVLPNSFILVSSQFPLVKYKEG